MVHGLYFKCTGFRGINRQIGFRTALTTLPMDPEAEVPHGDRSRWSSHLRWRRPQFWSRIQHAKEVGVPAARVTIPKTHDNERDQSSERPSRSRLPLIDRTRPTRQKQAGTGAI